MATIDVLPKAFAERMKMQLGAAYEDFLAALDTPSPTSIRLHHIKGRADFDLNKNVPWCPSGYYLETRPHFHLDPHWHAGAYYVQEASSMLLDYLLAALQLDKRPRTWVDLCAAPGGKTGILARYMQPEDVLVANEVVPQRRAILRENLTKAGITNSFVTGESASAFAQLPMDVLLVDAPCAGEGMMRKDPEAIRQWTPELVTSCSMMQRQIIHDAISGLRQDGYLIYSTCSYSMEENIFNVRQYADAFGLEPVEISIPAEWGIQKVQEGKATGYQLYPHKVMGEGLFIAVLKQPHHEEKSITKNKQNISAFGKVPDGIKAQIEGIEDHVALKQHIANPILHAAAETKANEILNVIPRATLISETMEQKGKDFIPGHFLAMTSWRFPAFGLINLDLDASLGYLERNTGSLPTSGQQGWNLIQYNQSHLGWAKLTQQGWKNYYPMNWRLRDRRIK